ncbi:MAG: Tol-Pal system beta propeller repeat protein TolB [Deltaproteobacteria bacterium]|nr:Tol-Pal system beta propeller repeat protein TolB [Deltaproteobacteria bacterium]
MSGIGLRAEPAAERYNRNRVTGLLLGVVVLLVMSPLTGKAQINLQITKEGGQSLPIAIAPLQGANGAEGSGIGNEFAEVLSRDLDLSGYFRVMSRGGEAGAGEGVLAEDINFQNWSDLGALTLVKGVVSSEGDNLTIEARLFDVALRRQLGGKRYRGERRELRRMAHRFADEVMLLLTGERGPFDSRIAFVSTRGGGRAKELYVTDLSGRQISALTRDRSLSLGPSWDPSASMLAYCSYRHGGPYPYLLDVRTGDQTRLSSTVGYSGGRWSPDSSTIAVSLEQDGNSDLFLLTPEGRVVRRLTEDSGIDVSPTWSPDGRRIAFCSSRRGGPQIYVMDVGSGNIRRLTYQGDYNTSPAWSPKGDLIAYTTRSGGFRVMVMPVNGGEPRSLGAGEDPSWSPDGRYVVFSQRGRLMIARRDGNSVKELTRGGGDDTSPAWSPRLE